MTKEQIYSWVRETAEMMGALNKTQETIDKVRAHIELSEATGKADQQAQLEKNLTLLLKEEQQIQDVLLARTRVGGVDRLYDYVVDMQLRVDHMNGFFENWRRNVTQYEIAAEGNFLDDDSRKKSLELLEGFEHQYEVAKKVAQQAIPNTVEIIRV